MRVLLVVAMALGSALMWIGLPIGLVYLASQATNSTQPSLGPYMIVIVGLPIGMTLIGKGLASLDRAYGRLAGMAEERYRPKWEKSMRGERGAARRWRVLDTVMMWSVLVCFLAMAVWFFGFAGSSLPGA